MNPAAKLTRKAKEHLAQLCCAYSPLAMRSTTQQS